MHVKFRTLGAGVAADDLFYSTGGKAHPVQVDTESRSVYYEYSGPVTGLSFFRLVPGPDGKPVPQTVALADLTGAGNRPLLVFMKNPDQADALLVRGFPDSVKDIPPGGYRFLNFTACQIGIILGTEKMVIKPGGSAIMQMNPPNGRLVSQVMLYGLLDNVAKPVYSNIWAFDAKVRQIVLVTPTNMSVTGGEVKCLSESVENISADDKPGE